MRNLLWKDYIGASKSENTLEYYKKLYGSVDGASKVIEYHLREKEVSSLEGLYGTVEAIDDMVFGQFIIAERALASGLEPYEALSALAVAVVRPIDDKEYDNTDRAKELQHADDLREHDAAEILKAIEEYTVIRDVFIKDTYKGVFYIENEETEDDEVIDKETESEPKTMEEHFSNNWYWYNIVRVLANEVIWEYERIYMTPMSQIAPEMAFRRHKDIVEEIQRKRNEMLSK
jgi:hypothetical protein